MQHRDTVAGGRDTGTDTDGVRCFLAVPVEEPALGDAQRLLASLREDIAGMRWARPETLHITVHFFGTIDDAAAFSAVELVRHEVSRTERFAMDVGRLGAFLPRVLWLGPRGDVAELHEFAHRCISALRDGGVATETRAYRPHCTLGRVRGAWSAEQRAAWVAATAAALPPLRFTASRLVLYESRPAPGGAIHTSRAEIALGAGSAMPRVG